MKVLHVIPSLSPAHGGPSVALPIIERALSDVGIVVDTVTTDDDGPGKHCVKALGMPLCENGVTRWYFKKESEFYKISRPLRRWLKQEVARYDLVHIHAAFSFASTVAAHTARREQIPYILRPLGVLNRYGMTQRRAFLKRLSWKWLEGPLFRDADAVHFTSEDEQIEAESLGQPLQSVVIPIGLERPEVGIPERFYNTYPRLRDKRIVLFLSRLDPKKNIESLVRAIATLQSDVPGIALVIAGDGDTEYEAALRKLSDDLGVSGLVYWLGRVDGDLKWHMLASAEIFILPSFSENLGIAVLEAMFARLPCVVTPGVALSREISAAGAGLVVSPDAKSIAVGLSRLLRDRKSSSLFGANAFRLAETEFSASTMAKNLSRLYQDILSQKQEVLAART